MMAVLRARDLTFVRRGGHFRRACPHYERFRCVHWCLFRRYALESSSGGGFRKSSGSISDRRDDSNSQAEKEEDGIQLADCGNGTRAKHCTCTRADAGHGRRANTHGPGGREKGRAQRELCLDATKSKTGDSDRTGPCRGRVGCSRRAFGNEASTEKTAATRCAIRGGERLGARSDVAFGGTINGNQRAFTRVPLRSETPQRYRKRSLRGDRRHRIRNSD